MFSVVQNLRSPIILDDSLELAEAVALGIGSESGTGPLAHSHIQTALLSMSGYEKSPIPDVKDTSESYD
ncbi:MAG: hypothetical protein Q9187_007301 [Circinaria calcarea]